MKNKNYRKSTFSIFDLKFVQEGYTAEETWNGFAVPYFEFPQAYKIMEELNGNQLKEIGKSSEEYTSYYDEKTDTFHLLTEYSDPEEIKGEWITIDEQKIKVYAMGNGWVWEEK